MEDTNDLRAAATSRDTKHDAAGEAENRANMLTLEIVFLGLIGLLVVAAFLEATTYQIVSSRTPFVIMVPLIALIAFQGQRLYKARLESNFAGRLKQAFAGQMPSLNKVVSSSLWMALLLVMVVVLGHLAAITIYSFMLMWYMEKERLKLAVIVAVATTAIIYVLFEYGFNVELYKGLIIRYFLGFRDFG